MNKFFGKIGYGVQVETSPGIWENQITEQDYYGDVFKNTSRNIEGSNLNDDIKLNNIISIVADPFALSNYQSMKYVTWLGSKWKISLIEIKRPRIILTIGSVYNE